VSSLTVKWTIAHVVCRLQHDKDSQAWKKLQMLVMQLRKCCNHPYLFPDAEPSFDGLTTGATLCVARTCV
jgi:hypothetical protein